jgi:hypothetical protein
VKAVELWDGSSYGVGFLTLEEILAPLLPRVLATTWEVADYVYPNGEEYFWVGGDGDDRIERLANTGTRISGEKLAELAQTTSQIIWGTFRGYDSYDAAVSWIAIHAIDSTFWRVETGDVATRQLMMKSFRDVRLNE